MANVQLAVVLDRRQTHAHAAARLLLEPASMLLTLLLIVLLVAALGSVPAWPHSRGWGYYPSGGLGLLVIILLIVFLLSPHHVWW